MVVQRQQDEKPGEAGAEVSVPDEERLARYESYEKLLIRWMRLGLLTPGVAGVVLCVCAVLLFTAEAQYRSHEAVLITMLAVGGTLIVGAATLATWRPEGFATYLKMHATLVESPDGTSNTRSAD